MDAVRLLKTDHRKVEKLLETLDSTTERGVKTRQELFGKIKAEMQVHEAIEEEIFYPALKGASQGQRGSSRGLRGASCRR